MDRQSRTEYVVDWSGQGYEQLIQQMREFLNLKRQVDAAVRQGIGTGAQAPSVTGATIGGQVGATSNREAADAQRAYARALRQEASHHERVAQQGQRQQQQTPRVFAGISNVGLQSDEQWAGYVKAIKDRHEQALKNNEQLNQADRGILSNATQIAGIMGQRKAAEEKAAEGGILSKVVGVAGSIGPPELYYAQMALGPWGLGLGPLGVAAGLGIGGALALGGMVYNTTASQLAMARLVAGISPSGGGTAVTPADMGLADTLTQVGAGFGLGRQDVFNLLPTAADYNLPGGALAPVVTGGLTRAAQGELTNQQGVQLQALVASRVTGGNAQRASQEFAKLDDAIKQTGADTHTVYQAILQDGNALRAGIDLTQFATVDAALKGTGLNPLDVVGGGIQSTGVQRLSQAAALGMSEAQFTALQAQPAQFARRLQSYAQGLMAQTKSPSATEAVLQAQGFIAGGTNADAVLQAILSGNYRQPAPAAPKTPAQLSQQVAQATVQAMTVNTQSLTIQAQLGLAAQLGQQAVTGVVTQPGAALPAGAALEARALPGATADVFGNPTLAAVAAAIPAFGAAAVGAQLVRHMLDITIRDAAGNVLGQQSLELTGSSTQTRTTTPGQGPPANVSVVAPRTPNSTNANGR